MKNGSAIVKLFVILVVIAILFWFNQSYLQLTPADIRTWILSFGWMSPIVYIVLYTFRPLILFPASILSLTGGLAFGAFWGTVLTVIGATAGAVLSFALARLLGKRVLRTEWKGNMKRVQAQMETRGLLYVLLLRLIPLFPFDLISYAAGLSSIRLRVYLIGTLFGIIPGTFAFNLLGASFAEGAWQEILIATVVFVLALAIPILFRKRLEGGLQ